MDRFRSSPMLIVFVVLAALSSCAGQEQPLSDVGIENAPASYLWTPSEEVRDSILLVPRDDGRGGDLLNGIELVASTPDSARGGRGQQIIWSDSASVEDRRLLLDRADAHGVSEVWFLGIVEFWPSCADESHSGGCPIVAELTSSDAEILQLVSEHAPQRLKVISQ